MSEPWQCPACSGWVAPGVKVHHCGANTGATPGGLLLLADGSGSSSKSVTKDGRQAYNQGYEPGFVSFWTIYPLHRDKRKAQKAWRNAIRRATPDEINTGATRYRRDPNRVFQFTKYAEGWLNGDGWLDDPLPPRLASGIQPAAPDPHAWEAEAEEFVKGTRWEKA